MFRLILIWPTPELMKLLISDTRPYFLNLDTPSLLQSDLFVCIMLGGWGSLFTGL